MGIGVFFQEIFHLLLQAVGVFFDVASWSWREHATQ